MELNQRVWHGYYREAGEQVTPDARGKDGTIKDAHGCISQWVRDSKGHLMSVWDCELIGA